MYRSSHHFYRNYNIGLPGKLKSNFCPAFFVRPSLANSSVKIWSSCNKSSKDISINCDFLHFKLRQHIQFSVMFLHVFQWNVGFYLHGNQEFLIEKIKIRRNFIMPKTTHFIYIRLYVISPRIPCLIHYYRIQNKCALWQNAVGLNEIL